MMGDVRGEQPEKLFGLVERGMEIAPDLLALLLRRNQQLAERLDRVCRPVRNHLAERGGDRLLHGERFEVLARAHFIRGGGFSS